MPTSKSRQPSPKARKAGAERTRSTASTAKPRARRGEPKKDSEGFPDRIYGVASPHSVSGVSMFTQGLAIDASNVAAFESDPELVSRAVLRLQDAGFEVLYATTRTINVVGSRQTYERAFATRIVQVEVEEVKSGGEVGTSTHFDCADTDMFGHIDTANTAFADVLEGVAIEEPYALQSLTAFPPTVPYWHLDVPGDVSLGCNADRAHRSGVTGAGIHIAMVDSGQAPHPFFTDRGYRVEPTVLGPGTSAPTADGIGHGTGESANIFATAPDITLHPVKCADASGTLVNTTAAIAAAAALNPTIISCSWGSSVRTGPLSAARQALAAEIAAAVASGIIVCFSASNGGWGFPAQMPDVIAVGGVYMDRDGSMRASDYASGFQSMVYPGRRVPDVCGLVGMRPGAIYIMLPQPDGAAIENGNAGGAFPNGDETGLDDGWAAFSGTSASCPQVAGVCALIKQACPRLTPAQVKDILMRTARDVTTGTSSALPGLLPGTTVPGSPAGPGADDATGAGMVDAYRAVLLAKLRCIVQPVVPPLPPFPPIVQPRLPLFPVTPTFPPIVQPQLPVFPLAPTFPPLLNPTIPFLPPRIAPLAPIGPGPLESAMPITQEDIAALEQMLLDTGESPF